MMNLVATNPKDLSNENLLQLCEHYGAQTKLWRQKFAGLLPEVSKRELYRKKGCQSIFEFAKKLAGMSEEQVRTVLRLERKFENKPVLQNLLIKGAVSANKLVRVAAVATTENQEFWAEQVKILSKDALETLVRDERIGKNQQDFGTFSSSKIEDKNGYNKAKNNHKSLPGQTFSQDLFDDVKLLEKFSPELKKKLQTMIEKGLDINKILLKLLEKRDQLIAGQKEQISREIRSSNEQIVQEILGQIFGGASRYIPAKIKKIIAEEQGNKCSILSCHHPAEVIHHTQRFALSQNHDPSYLAKLCKQHHQIAHSIDQKYQVARAGHLVVADTA